MQSEQLTVDDNTKERVIMYYQDCYNLESACAMANITEDQAYLLRQDQSFMARLTYYKNKEIGYMVKKIKISMESEKSSDVLNACKLMSKVLDYDKLTTNKQQLLDDTNRAQSIIIDGESVN